MSSFKQRQPTLTQTAVQTPNKTRPYVADHKKPPHWPKRHDATWFSLQVRENGKQVTTVEAGKTYTLLLRGGATRTDFHTKEIKVQKSIRLRLSCKTVPNVKMSCVTKPDIRACNYTLSYEQAMNLRKEITLSVPKDFPHCQLQIQVYYELPELKEVLGTLALEVVGAYNPENPALLKVWQLEAGLPEEVAILAISPYPDSKKQFAFKIYGWHHAKRSLEESCNSASIVNVAALMQRKDPASDILGKAKAFSQQLTGYLKEWLKALLQRYGTDLCIIIIDNTTLEIPWELLEVEERRLLGAAAKIVRWQPAEYSNKRTLVVKKTKKACNARSSVLAYLHPEFKLDEVEAERKVLTPLSDMCSSLNDLERKLNFALERENVGLIYFGCHAKEGQTIQGHCKSKLTSASLANMNIVEGERPTIFVNACESARIIRDNTWDSSSFVDVFLERCASGYIGTLGQVGIQLASEIAERILTEAQQEDGVQIAEILRLLRAEAVNEYLSIYKIEEMWNNKSNLEKAMLYTFMYIYYGSPYTRLRLKPRGIA